MPWYSIKNINTIDSPSLVLYTQHLQQNLETMSALVNGNYARMMPHIKTNKMSQVIKQMLALGITQFKASTIAEAELAATCGAKFVVIAYQLVGPKIERFIKLITTFPNTEFATLADNRFTVSTLEELALAHNLKISVYIDINNGMNRSGIEFGDDFKTLATNLSSSNNLTFKGLHVYDGHIKGKNSYDRKEIVENAMHSVEQYFKTLQAKYPELQMICGGTPTFSSHASEINRICSPGTCVFWDWNYNDKLPEQDFDYAVLVVTRVISKPTQGIITIDLGHKAIGAENPIDKRVKFLNLDDYELLSQSEEHGVLKVKNSDNLNIGDVLYGVPYHICPTVNLYRDMSVISNHEKVATWEIEATTRKLTI